MLEKNIMQVYSKWEVIMGEYFCLVWGASRGLGNAIKVPICMCMYILMKQIEAMESEGKEDTSTLVV